ncbi:MAG: sugar kinase [Burkholderiaceae bacterium]|nr:sugar kinase [Burkholderiaceae bacterium]
MASDSPIRVALFGECMIELQGQAFGPMSQGFGGDTLNTAVYLSRCTRGQPMSVHYSTALGDDNLSAGMMQRWAAEGIALDLVRRLPGRMPGLYLIEVDGRGERHFSYWRDQAAARAYFDTDAASEPTPLEAHPLPCDWLYCSGISLAILPPAGRARLFALMDRLRATGGRVVFDNNHRPRLWPDAAVARDAYEQAFARADIALITLDDHQAWLGRSQADGRPVAADLALAHAAALPVPELVVKRGAEATLWRQAGSDWHSVATEAVAQVVDTTAAGDSFAAGYLARRLAGDGPAEAAAFGNRLAARVIQHRGAVIPAEAMADLLPQLA